jgi:glycerophosphoryl diester phosphodiesterase
MLPLLIARVQREVGMQLDAPAHDSRRPSSNRRDGTWPPLQVAASYGSRALLALCLFSGASACAMPSAVGSDWTESALSVSCASPTSLTLRSSRLWLPTDDSPPDTATLVSASNSSRPLGCRFHTVGTGWDTLPQLTGTHELGTTGYALDFRSARQGHSSIPIRVNGSRDQRLYIMTASRAFAERASGHAGAGQFWPENTLLGLRQAIAAHLPAAEIDVRLTQDSVFVLMHDETVDRTTPATGLVSTLTAAELTELDAGSWLGPEFSTERVPTLRDALELAGTGGLLLILDLKPQSALDAERYAELLLNELDEVAATEHALLLTSSVGLLRQLRDQSNSARLVFFSWGFQPWEVALSREEELEGIMHHPDSLLLPESAALTESLRQAGVRIFASTTNRPLKADSLIEFRGVDLILSDVPPLVYRLPLSPIR